MSFMVIKGVVRQCEVTAERVLGYHMVLKENLLQVNL